MLATIALLLAAPSFAVVPPALTRREPSRAQDSAQSSDSAATPELPADLSRWLGEVATLQARGELDGAREHLAALVEDGVYAVLLAGAPEVVLAGLAGIDRVAKSLGVRAIRGIVLEEWVRRLSASLPADHPNLLRARGNLAVTLAALGDLPGARAHFQAVLESFERTLPADHPDLLVARQNLAGTMYEMGDIRGSFALQKAVLEVRERTLPADHSDLLEGRMNLALTMKAMGDLPGARALFETVVTVYERTLPEDHPALLIARLSAATTLDAMGDFSGARAVFEVVLEVYERTLPPDDPSLLGTRHNLAVTMSKMGDFPAARALQEIVLAARERTLPEDHPDLLTVRLNLAATMSEMGDLHGSRVLQEAVLETRERTLPEDHLDLLRAREHLAFTMGALGDHPGARALQETLLEALERTLPEGHPRLLTARQNLAATMSEMGDLHGSHALLEAVLEVHERTLPADHPVLLGARQNLAFATLELGDLPGALSATEKLAMGMLRRLQSLPTLAPREAREAARAEARRLSWALFLGDVSESEPMRAMVFSLCETMRHVSTATLTTVFGEDSTLVLQREEIYAVRARLNDLVAGGTDSGGLPEDFANEVARLTRERDRLERELRVVVGEGGGDVPHIRVEDVARALPENAVAIGYKRLKGWRLDTESGRVVDPGEQLFAHLVRPDGSLELIDLGAVAELEELASAWRRAVGSPISSRGLGMDAERPALPAEADKIGEALRSRVLDPILEAAGDARVLHVCLDSFLHLLPLDALPAPVSMGAMESMQTGEDRVVGERRRLHTEISFARLLAPRSGPDTEPALFALGAVDYAADQVEAVSSTSVAASAPVEAGTRSGGLASGFELLAETGAEIEGIGGLFEGAFGVEPRLMKAERASKFSFHALAPGKRFLHVATHGWFAPETIKSALDTRPNADRLWSPMSALQTVTGLAPMTLCGLAFAGANHGRDSLGRVPGIMTAEELAGYDLSACDLAVLSACETNVGIRRAGQGIQSLQTALHAAGARTAITSLWKVDDAATRKLMERFYTYLWVEEMGKADALWKAKCDLRAEGHPVRDWAAWVLSGDPD